LHQHMNYLLRLIGVIVLGLVLQQCPTQPVSAPEPGAIAVEYTTATATWLRVQVADTARQAGLRVYRDTVQVAELAMAPADTTLLDTGLTPNTIYHYHTVRVQAGHERASSEPLSVTTLPTTSHEFTTTMDTLGASDAGSSVLHDVAIIDEENIWVVGEIRADSGVFGAAVWDGTQWKLRQLIAGISNVRPRGIWAVSPTDIWFASGSIYHWDGNQTTVEWVRNTHSRETIETVWGTSPTNIYFGGTQGLLIHYDGQTFTRLVSDTETRIQDIWGARDPRTGAWQVLCAASPGYGTANSGLYRIMPDQTVEPLPWVDGRAANSVWFDHPFALFACGSGIFQRLSSGPWEEIGGIEVIPANTERIRGTAPNNFFVVSDFGHIAHYNGRDFLVYQPNPEILYESCAVTKDGLVAVGNISRRALVLRMRRIE